jgi:HPt (histidine-containing phosphotransfer) domain-containing protein
MSGVGQGDVWVAKPDPDLEDLIPSFLQNRKNELVEMEAALGRRDFDSIARSAHIWKGIARPYGFIHLEFMSRQIEDAAIKHNDHEVADILRDIREYLYNVKIIYEI